jgi:hypothetical protein
VAWYRIIPRTGHSLKGKMLAVGVLFDYFAAASDEEVGR